LYKSIPLLLLFFASVATFSQPEKDGALTISSGSVVVNSYAPISSSISAGSSTLSLPNENLMRLCVGDLIMVYQAQGVSMNTLDNTANYGDITSYNSAGLYEFKYILNINGAVVTTQTAFTNSFSLSGKPQVIKVPQYTTLTINSGATIVPKAWKDTIISAVNYRFGGLVVIHASNIINDGAISASGCGFRGGNVTNSDDVYRHTDYVTNLPNKGAEKGEGVFGSQVDYDINNGRYCRGAAANAGGGGDCNNSGGGGGANGFNGNPWIGQGVMMIDATNLLAAWALDPGYISNSNALTNSSGGGRGGYSYGSENRNPSIDGPGDPTWGPDLRREVGGLGGRGLSNINSENRIYLGGAGGSGQANDSGGSSGGNGGGIIYLIATTGITGSGVISANGESAGNSTIDGAGGGGAGGSIVLKANAAATQTVFANGGNGGNHVFSSIESFGPGGGGGGGFIAVASVGPILFVNGGLNGVSNSTALMGTMTSNGATNGASGNSVSVTSAFVTFSPIVWSVNSNTPCTGFDLFLTSNSSYPFSNITYQWVGPNEHSSSGQNANIGNAPSLAAGVYSFSVLDDNVGCGLIYTTSINVIVDLTPTLSAIGSTVCAGQTITLGVNSSAGINFDWTDSNSFAATGSSTFIPNAQTTMSGAYNVTVTSAFGCTNSASANVIVNPIPIILSASGSTACSGQSVTLDVNSLSASTFQWSGPNSFLESGQSVTIPNAQTNMSGVYSVIVTAAAGCSNTASVTILVNASPILTVSDSTVCVGQPANINLTAVGGLSYSWIGPKGFMSLEKDITIPFANDETAGNYTVTVTAANACKSIAFAKLIVNTLPIPELTTEQNIQKICVNDQITLQSKSAGFTAYKWSGPDGFSSYKANSSLKAISVKQGGTYTLNVTDNNSCNGFTTTVVIVNALPEATLSVNNNKNCVPFCSNFSLQTAESIETLVSTLWTVNGKGASSNYCFKQFGKYLVKADFIDVAGCQNTATYNVIAYPSPSANFEFAPLHPVENEDEVIFYDGSEGDSIVSRNWYFEKDIVYQVTKKQNPSYLFTNSGLYPVTLVIKNTFGCADTVVKIVAIGEDYSFYVPNTFTPNDDGVNDTFEPKGHGISKYNMTVFDRWGKKVFVTTDFSQNWDGKYSGQDCKDDIYTWQVTITLSDFRVKTYTGHVTLYR
jgi:gliding motility-associated-like protein